MPTVLCGPSAAAVRWDIKRGTYTKFTVNDGLASNDVRAAAALPAGEIWFGTDGGGVSRFDCRTWTTYTKADGLASDEVAAIAVARPVTLRLQDMDDSHLE
jgi:ligand-binding sensor domain-containing protein